MKHLFGSHTSDFIKIYLIGLLIVPLYYFVENSQFENLIMYLAFICDGGHVYSTYAESFFDSNENKQWYVYKNIGTAFLLNAFLIFSFKEYFYFYIFYYTVYHNIKQGVGVSLLFNIKKEMIFKIKTLTYLVTLIPFIGYHLLDVPMNMSKIKFDHSLFTIVKIESLKIPNAELYIVFLLSMTYAYLIYLMYIDSRNIKAYLTIAFYGLVYLFGFIIFKNIIFSYCILIFSHGIPYFFLMDMRMKHHSIKFFSEYSYLILATFFILGGLTEFFNEDLNNDILHNFMVAIFWTPTIGHYMMDADIWKKSHSKMKKIFPK